MEKKYEIIGENGIFEKLFRVEYEDVNSLLQLKPQRAIEFCQNMAIRHSDEAGYTSEYFVENKKGWVLTGWEAKFHSFPAQNQFFEIKTWTKPHKRLQSDRSYEACDMDGNKLFSVNSRWFLMDTEKRKPIRIPKGFLETYNIADIPNAIPDGEYLQSELDAYTHESSREFKVTRRDIDSNNHTNNISYIDWAMDDLTDDIYYNMQITDLVAEYKLEAQLGMTIRSDYYRRPLDNGRIEVSSVFSCAEDNSYLCRITTVWTNK